MDKPKLSIIVPIYNSEEHLEKTADAILGNTYENIELILVNDGSTDGSAARLEGYRNDSRVKILHKENGGAASARNLGLEAATGEWIAYADDDDIPEPDMYEYLMSEALESGADIVQCATFVDFPDRTEIMHSAGKKISVKSPDGMNSEFFRALAFSTWSKIYKRERVASLRYDTRFRIGEDLYYNLAALLSSRLTVLLPEPKYHYVQREGSICYSVPTEESLTSFRRMLESATELYGDHKGMRSFIFSENMKNNADICSKITLSGEGNFTPVMAEVRAEIKRYFFKMLLARDIIVKVKIKLILIAFFPRIYRRSLIRSKNEIH